MADLLSYALTTVADVKESLGIASSDTSKDNLITRKINQATLMIENYTGRRFAETTYTNEEYDATNTDQLVLKQRPITAFTSFERRDTTINESDWDTVESTLYFVDTNAAVLDLLFQATGYWNRYRVAYTAGYATIPADLAEACATLAAYLVETGTSGTNIKKKTEGGRSIEYFDPTANKANTSDMFDVLNISQIINSYANNPILPDK